MKSKRSITFGKVFGILGVVLWGWAIQTDTSLIAFSAGVLITCAYFMWLHKVIFARQIAAAERAERNKKHKVRFVK